MILRTEGECEGDLSCEFLNEATRFSIGAAALVLELLPLVVSLEAGEATPFPLAFPIALAVVPEGESILAEISVDAGEGGSKD
jgi:hypothetical protein